MKIFAAPRQLLLLKIDQTHQGGVGDCHSNDDGTDGLKSDRRNQGYEGRRDDADDNTVQDALHNVRRDDSDEGRRDDTGGNTVQDARHNVRQDDSNEDHDDGQVSRYDVRQDDSDDDSTDIKYDCQSNGSFIVQQDIEKFCLEQIRKYKPDRIYVEMNTNLPMLRKKFPEIMNVTSTVTLIYWQMLDAYMVKNRQMLSLMVSESQQVTFRGCPSKDLLAPYSQEFKLMNHRASYLRQDPMGYHEKAFDLFVPYSLNDEMITITKKEYLAFWLDAADHPEHYEGKRICFPDPLELRQNANGSAWTAGRMVMTCCMADLQFMSLELITPDAEPVQEGKNTTELKTHDSGIIQEGWITMEAMGRIAEDEYRRKVLKIVPQVMTPAAAPKSAILMAGGSRTQSGIPMAGGSRT